VIKHRIFRTSSLIPVIVIVMQRTGHGFLWRPGDDEYPCKSGSATVQESDNFMEFGGSEITIENSRANDR
jgi:hypothetical protein